LSLTFAEGILVVLGHVGRVAVEVGPGADVVAGRPGLLEVLAELEHLVNLDALQRVRDGVEGL